MILPHHVEGQLAMIADSIKVKGYSCFGDNWVGFDEFKPITVIIGKNNSGKSHLIDLVNQLTVDKLTQLKLSTVCSGILDEQSLKEIFREDVAGKPFSSELYGGGYNESTNHWAHTGTKFLGLAFKWPCFLTPSRKRQPEGNEPV